MQTTIMQIFQKLGTMLNSIIEAQVRNSTKYLTFGQPTKHGSIKEIGLHSSSVFIPSVKQTGPKAYLEA